jgi:DNA-directed RNA polymerase subunit RPC12/RpoP
MNVEYVCPQCERSSRAEISAEAAELRCAYCGDQMSIPPGALEAEKLHRCLVCPSSDLFVRKDFPQRLGVTVVAIGILASCVAWAYHQLIPTFVILFLTALIDVVLYLVVPNALMCYRCGAQYRGAPGLGTHSSFDLETHERHRQHNARLAEQRQKARMAEQHERSA